MLTNMAYDTLYLILPQKIEECEPGTTDENCSLTCPPDYFGLQCREQCNCSPDEYCDPINGCLANSTLVTSAELGILLSLKGKRLSTVFKLFIQYSQLE